MEEEESNYNIGTKTMNLKAVVAIIIYFIAFILYSYFFRIEKNVDSAFLVKPIIIPSIAFAYFFLTKNTFYFMNLYLFLIIYFADNLIVLEDRSLYAFSTYLYLITLSVLFHYVVIDSKIFDKLNTLKKAYPFLLLMLLVSVFIVKIYYYIIDKSFKETYLIGLYVFLFLALLFLAIFNAIKHKSRASVFLLATLFSLFISDVLTAINSYYFKEDFLIYVACVFEVPVYYFLLRYFLHREELIIQ